MSTPQSDSYLRQALWAAANPLPAPTPPPGYRLAEGVEPGLYVFVPVADDE